MSWTFIDQNLIFTGHNEVVLLVPVILITGGGPSASVHAGIHIPQRCAPLPGSMHTPGKHTPWEAHTPREAHLPGSRPPRSIHPPGSMHPLGSTPPAPGSRLQHTVNEHQYTSYWNAFLFLNASANLCVT